MVIDRLGDLRCHRLREHARQIIPRNRTTHSPWRWRASAVLLGGIGRAVGWHIRPQRLRF